MLSDGGQIVRDDLQDVPGCIAGIWGMDRGDFVALGDGLGGPRLLLDCFLQGLLSFWEALGAISGRFGGPWLTVEGLGSIAGHRQGTQSSLWQTVASKWMVLRQSLGDLSKHLGGRW